MAYIISSGITSEGIALTNDSMTILDSGTANSTTLNTSGYLYVSSGGLANSTTVNSRGKIWVLSGGLVNSTTINYDGHLNISKGGIANYAIAKNRGWIDVNDGGTLNNAIVTQSGRIYVYTGGAASFTTVQENAVFYLGFSGYGLGGFADKTTVNSGGSMFVSSGGTANSVTINSFGNLYISSGGTVNGATVDSDGRIYVLNRGVANSVMVNNGGYLYVSSGGTALDIICTPFYGGVTVANGAYVTYDISPLDLTGVYYGSGNTLISSAPALESIDMDSGTSMLVFSSGTATEIVVNSGALLQIARNGIANSATVDPGGNLYVSSGGTATNVLENGGYVEFADDADVTFTANLFSDLHLSNASATVHSGTTANSTTVNSNGHLIISRGGTANTTTVNSGGNLYVSSGGEANSTTVNSSGNLYVSNYGTANSATVNNGGNVFVNNGGAVTDITVNNGGNAYISSGGSAAGATVNSGGILSVSSGGTATEIVWTPCFGDVSIENGAYVTFASELSGVYYGSDNVLLSHAQIIESIAISGTMSVISDGAVYDIAVNNGGNLKVSGGQATRTTVNYGGNLHISSGGEANSATVYGNVYVSDEGTANRITVSSGGRMFVSGGGIANNATVVGRQYYGYGYISVFNGGVINNATVNNSGVLNISSGGMANSTTIYSNGNLNIYSGGTANDTIVLSQGWINVYEGGNASNVMASNAGRIYVYSGGSADSTTIQGNAGFWLGLEGYGMGGFADHTTVNSGGSMFVSANGSANNTTVNFRGSMFVSSGGTATGIVENGGYVKVEDGAQATFLSNSFSGLGLQNASAAIHSGTTANSVTITSGGYLYLSDRGIVNSTFIYSSGMIYISSGGILTGRTYCMGGIIYAYDGAIVNYDLTRTNQGAFPLISDLSCIQGAATYTITVKANQAEGTYILAEGASAFDQTITVKNVIGEELGVLTVGGSTAIAGVNYALNLTDNTLSLTIGEKETPLPYTSDGLLFWNETGSVESGDLFHDILILSGGSVIVSGGGSVYSATVNSGGYFFVSSAAAAHAIIENGGYVIVEDGAEAVFLENTINALTLERTSATLHSGTTANNATVNISGYLDVYGGSANGATVKSSGFLRVYDGGSANSTTVYSGGNLNISSGGTANNTIVSGYSRIVANLNVYSGGVASNTIVSGGYYYGSAYLNVYSGGVASNAVVSGYDYNGYGYLNVFSGGTANNATIKTSGYFIVSSGGVANSTTVSFGQLYVSNGGYVSQAIIFGKTDRQQGDIYLSNGATAEDVTVEQYGDFYVSSGGTVNNVTVNVYGGMWVSSGGTATEIKENGGYVWVQNGANAVFASNTFSGAVLNSAASATVHSGTTAVNVTLNQSSYLAVYSGGTATDLVWTPCNGTLWVEEGAYVTYDSLPEGVFYGGGGVLSSNAMKMEEITVLTGQEMYVMPNGLANSTTVSSGGNMYVSSGGLANSTTVSSGGNMYVSSGATANNTVVHSNGFMRVSSGGTAAHIEASSGARLDLSIAPDTYIEGTYADSAFEVKDGSATYYSVNSGNILRVSSGGMASRTYVYGGGNLYISNGGAANRTVLSNGLMHVSSGGVANSTTMNNGSIFISSGGTADTVIVNNGGLFISNGGTGNEVTVNNEAGMHISSGGTATNAIVANNAWLYVSAGGTATNLTASGTRVRIDVSSDTYITGTSAGFDFEIKNGVVSGYTVNSGGNLNILSGCVASGISTTWSGFVTISSGGLLKDSYLSGGIGKRMVTVEAGGVASSVQVVNCVDLFVSGSAYDIVLKEGRSNDKSDLYLCGGYAERVTVGSFGYYDMSGGTASNTTIEQGGNMYMFSGGVASDLRINSGGYLSIEHAKLTGKITIADGGVIHAGQGTVIDFDISRLAPGMGALLNNLSLIQDDAPAFTLTVSDLQWNGTYRLARGVTEFDNLISVKSTASETIHMVAVDETANVDGIEYTLKLTNDTLSVTVTGGRDIPIIPVSADITDPTRTPVIVTAAFSDAAVMREYSFDNDTWHVYTEPVTFRQNGTVYFLGKDQRGFINEVASYEVANIDLTPPENPTASADITELTNSDVLVTAVFSEDAKLREYSFDGKTWMVYTEAVAFEQNGTVYFRAIDALGNESEIISYSVENIDKTPPSIPTAQANITHATNQSVSVSAQFSNDTVKREYSLDGQNWSEYQSPIQFTENGIVYFRAIDSVGNISETATYQVTNIDTAKPDKPTVSADITELTNTDVLVTAVFSEECTGKEYSFDGNVWRTYSGAIRFTENGIVYFRGTDAAGNVSEVESYTVDWIDKSAPSKPTAYPDVANITNGNVFVSAVYSEDSVAYEYSFDNKEWMEYTDAIMFSENGTVYFRGMDEAGNYSGVTKYVVSNIDKIAPAKPTPYADVTEITSGDVLVSAVFSNDSAVREYSLDGRTWKPYDEAVRFVKNGNVYFRSFDAAGNVSEVAGFTVNNIIKAAPEKPGISVDVTEPTGGSVTVSAVFSDETTTNQYSLDGENWLDYAGAVIFMENGSVSFRSVDVVGNVSEVATYQVTNIDKTPPEKPIPMANVTVPTNMDVLVTATFSEDSVLKQYSLDGENWGIYPGGILFGANLPVYFRSIDAAGNISEVASYTVTNVDRSAPVITLTGDNQTPTRQTTLTAEVDDGSTLYYSKDDSSDWTEYRDAITVSANATYNFRATDAAGNTGIGILTFENIQMGELVNAPDSGENDFLFKKGVWNDANIKVTNTVSGPGEINLDEAGTIDDEDGRHNMFGNDGTNKDAGDVAQIKVKDTAKLTFTIDSTAAATFYVYEKGKDKNNKDKQITVGKVSVKAGKPATLSICLTDSGDYYVAMIAKSAKKGMLGYYNVNVTGYDDMVFVDADEGGNNTAATGNVIEVGRDTTAIVLDTNEMIGSTEFVNFVGFSDSIDYAKLDLASSAYLSFNMKADGAAKFTLWKQSVNGGKLTKVVSKSLSAKSSYTGTTAAKFLDTDKYVYYVSMESTDAAKGGAAHYNVSVSSAVFFDSLDYDLINGHVYDKKKNLNTRLSEFRTNDIISSGKTEIFLDSNEIKQDGYSNFVGCNDKADYARFNVASECAVTFTINTTGVGTFVIWRNNAETKKLEALGKVEIKDSEKTGILTVSDLAEVEEYFISMTAKSTKANASGSVFYNVWADAALSENANDSLVMPETDILNMTDTLKFDEYDVDMPFASSSDFTSERIFEESGKGILASL